jgi:hypothetical protein
MRRLAVNRLLFILLPAQAASPVMAQEGMRPVPTTIAVSQVLADAIARRAFALIPPSDSSSVAVTLLPAGEAWFLEEPILKAARASGHVPDYSAATRYAADFGITEMRVELVNPRRPGLFSDRLVDRTVTLALWGKIVDRTTGRLLTGETWREQYTDTVLVDDLERLETPGVPATRGVLPPEGLFSSFLEPLILLGAVGVAVYLLFTSRS